MYLILNKIHLRCNYDISVNETMLKFNEISPLAITNEQNIQHIFKNLKTN